MSKRISPYVYPGIHDDKNEYTINRVAEVISEVFEIPVEILLNSTKRKIVKVRQLIIYVLWKKSKMDIGLVAAHFKRDRSTMVHSAKTAKDIIDTEDDYKTKYKLVLSRLGIEDVDNSV